MTGRPFGVAAHRLAAALCLGLAAANAVRVDSAVVLLTPKDVPLSKNRFHRLEVRAGNPQLRVLARNGYYGEAGGNSSSPSGRISVVPAK